MIRELNLLKPLSLETMTRIMVYLESRPLGEVYGLFTDIVSQLTITKESSINGPNPDSVGSDSASSGGGNSDGGGSGFPLISSE